PRWTSPPNPAATFMPVSVLKTVVFPEPAKPTRPTFMPQNTQALQKAHYPAAELPSLQGQVHFGSPSFVAGANAVFPTKIAHVRVVELCPTQAVRSDATRVMVGPVTPA